MNKKKVLLVIIVLVIIVLAIIKIITGSNSSSKTSTLKKNNSEEINSSININEDLSLEGTVKNLDNVVWNNATITQRDNKMSVMINLNNRSETDEVPERDLIVTVYNKEGKVMASQETHMDTISSNYGYTFLDVDFDIEEIDVVYDIKIEAK